MVPRRRSQSGHDRPVCDSRCVHVAVVGGGISGLAAAWFLSQADDPPRLTVLEAGVEVGGKLRLGDLAGHAVDAGAESMLARRPEASDLVRAVGRAQSLEPPVTSAARLLVDGTLRPFPAGTLMGIPGDMPALARSGVLTRRGMARARAEAALPSAAQRGDVSVGRLVTSRFGHEVTERLVEPLLGGVYAGHADRISLAAAVPAVAAARDRGQRLSAAVRDLGRAGGGSADGSAPFVGLVGGLGTFPPRLAAVSGADVRTRTTVRALHRTVEGRWLLETGPVPRTETLGADAVVLAVPAAAASRLLRPVVPAAAALLDVVEYASVAVVALGYRSADLPAGVLQGSGHLVPPREGREVKAVTYASRKWRWLAESVPDLVVVRMSVGRMGEQRVLQRDDSDLVALGADDLADVLGLQARPVAGSVFRWGGALPQYTVGHVSRAQRVHGLLGAERGLALCGAALDGVGIPACISSARSAADAVLRSLRPDATMAP